MGGFGVYESRSDDCFDFFPIRIQFSNDNGDFIMDKTDGFETIKKARDLIKNRNKLLTDKTRLEYEKISKRIFSAGSIDDVVAKLNRMTSKNTHTKAKVAARYFLANLLDGLLKKQDQLQREKDDTFLKVVADIEKVTHYFDKIDSAAMEKTIKARSKRQDIKNLPMDWRETVIQSVAKKDQIQVLVLAVAGCRPAELVTGVKVKIGPDQLRITIVGAKVTEKSGQPERTLTYTLPAECNLVMQLASRLGIGSHLIATDSAVRITCMIRDAAKRAYPQLRRSITAYCFRHQFASDLKASEIESDDISKAMGHCVDRAATRYGHKKMARGGISQLGVEAVREVRIRNTFIAKKKSHLFQP